MPRKILIDCDPGHDDAIALLLAHGDPAIELVGVTTVVGNQTIEKVTRNALAVAAVGGITDVPFAQGCGLPLIRPIENAESIHGESGLDGPVLPEPQIELDERHAVDLIIDTVMASEPGEITLVPIGGLTNIAIAARKEPRIVDRVREVVLMGGAYHEGNWGPVSEFNIVIDPEAAHIVFTAGWDVTMVGLDVTHKALATPPVREAIRAIDSAPARFADELLDFFAATNEREQGFAAPPVHDPCAVALVADPSIFTIERRPVSIELTGTHTLGMTVTDFRAPAPADCRTFVVTGIDADRFWGRVVEALRRL
ncbi:nucleoside hydrolase [Herbiconiux sp. L3-i23]|uniref:uridine-preferring nucleoside hydrolase UriH n=1 Tax=Herbiconiux sp. L3-i23 TaxID=2905871 RepID=UPI002051D035|nr:nucleoside hydrolase [Herbiconiux sp. L3-i23]BDI21694.1 ribonucleoside hydrolase [Herbiconiux sp. L3-i23]